MVGSTCGGRLGKLSEGCVPVEGEDAKVSRLWLSVVVWTHAKYSLWKSLQLGVVGIDLNAVQLQELNKGRLGKHDGVLLGYSSS